MPPETFDEVNRSAETVPARLHEILASTANKYALVWLLAIRSQSVSHTEINSCMIDIYFLYISNHSTSSQHIRYSKKYINSKL